jgi:hypothetical protein
MKGFRAFLWNWVSEQKLYLRIHLHKRFFLPLLFRRR